MTRDSRLMYEIADLTLHSLNGTLDDKSLAKFEEVLNANPKAVEYYQQIVWTHVGMKSMEGISGLSQSDNRACLDQDLWQAMLEAEKTAPQVKVSAKKELPEIKTADRVLVSNNGKEKKQIGKFNLMSLAMSAAAMILLLLFIRFAPPRTGIEVATLSDSIGAVWEGESVIDNTMRIESGKQEYILSEGLVKLAFDSQAMAVIEAPASFKVIGDNQIDLEYGRIYSIVPPDAIGFTVYSRGTKIVDLGTEFGVQTDVGGDTELYVYKGETKVTAGKRFRQTSAHVGRGDAKRVPVGSRAISDISFENTEFVRQINSENDLIWKGSKVVSLADIVGGGNGFGTGRQNYGVDPATGTFKPMNELNRNADNSYHPVKSNAFVDGVFVPNGSTPQVISTKGNIFAECPPTKGCYYLEVTNTPEHVMGISLRMGGIEYKQGGLPGLFMHANLGITYDLEQIRKQLHNAKLSHFQTAVGIDNQAWIPCNADFWILIDGVVKYEKRNAKQGFLDFVDINLAEDDKFLTLITTDGQDPDHRVVSNVELKSIHSDWCMFGNPILILE